MLLLPVVCYNLKCLKCRPIKGNSANIVKIMCHLGHTGSIWIFTSTKKAVRHESSDEESGHILNSVSDLDGNDTASEGCPNVTPVDTENFDENGVPEPGI